MKKNIGFLDRWVRMMVGIILLTLLSTTLPFKGIGYLGLILVITALLRYCPIYALFGINTNIKN